MVLILTEKNDYSTLNVIDWLESLNCDYLKITPANSIEIEWLKSDIVLKIENESFLLSSVKAYWYRRGFFNINIKKNTNSQIDNFQKIEFQKLIEIFHYKLGQKKHINVFNRSDVNKYIVSEVAQKVGLKIPAHNIISTKKDLLELSIEKVIATKSFSGQGLLKFNSFNGFLYTSLINTKDFNYPSSFFPSYFQQYIEKKYELRIFYLDREFYSMAIFSQNDKKTTIDFRNYNYKKPNRTIPFLLPNNIKQKLIILTEKLNINCGSIDMLVSKKNEYFFLEINPIGQFGMVSRPCNYRIEKKIANYLKKESDG